MSSLSSLFAAALTGVLGAFATGIVATAVNDWFHFYNSRGIGGGLTTVIIAAGGGIAFFILGLVVSRTLTGTPETAFYRALGISCGTVVALAATILLGGWLRADFPPKMNGETLELAVELRAPAGFSLPVQTDEADSFAGVRAVGGQIRLHGPLNVRRAMRVEGRWTFAAIAPLLTSARNRELVIHIGKVADATFPLPLAARPGRSDTEWSAWLVADPVAGQAESAPEKRFSARYRVKSAGLTQEQMEGEKAEQEQARFDALDANSPIEAWLNHTVPGTPEARITAAMNHIVSRPTYVAELAPVMVGISDDFALMALEVVAKLPPPQPALLPHVAAAGRDIARRIREVNAGAVGDDPHPSGGHSASQRFTAWMLAARTLRETAGGDFTPELGEILQQSRARPKTVLLQENVRGVASHYLKLWSHVEPLPGDPPPR